MPLLQTVTEIGGWQFNQGSPDPSRMEYSRLPVEYAWTNSIYPDMAIETFPSYTPLRWAHGVIQPWHRRTLLSFRDLYTRHTTHPTAASPNTLCHSWRSK